MRGTAGLLVVVGFIVILGRVYWGVLDLKKECITKVLVRTTEFSTVAAEVVKDIPGRNLHLPVANLTTKTYNLHPGIFQFLPSRPWFTVRYTDLYLKSTAVSVVEVINNLLSSER
jgi:hypothetical protein